MVGAHPYGAPHMRKHAQPILLSHDEAVERLNLIVAEIQRAREHCHSQLGRALDGAGAPHLLGEMTAAVDTYGLALGAQLTEMSEIKLLHPAAWHVSEGDRRQRAADHDLRQMAADSLALVLGLRWPRAAEP